MPFVLVTTLEGTLAPLRLDAATRGLKLELHIDPAIPTSLRGDAGRFARVLRELVDNAIKFTRAGGVWIDVDLATPGAEHVRVRVRDSGVGMSEEVIARVHEPFVQGVESSTCKHGGAGLALARRLVDELGGTWSLDSAVSRGTTLEFTLPFTRAPEFELANQPDPTSPTAAPPPSVEPTASLDPNVLADLRMLESLRPGTLAELAQLFFEQVDQEVEIIATAEQLDRVIQAAHAIKGSSAALGARELSVVAGAIERDARAGLPATPHIVALRHALAAVRPVIAALS